MHIRAYTHTHKHITKLPQLSPLGAVVSTGAAATPVLTTAVALQVARKSEPKVG